MHGRLLDSASGKACTSAVVALVSEDSILVSFTRSGRDGAWSLQKINEGNYQILVSHPAYEDYVANVTVAAGGTIEIGILHLLPRITVLHSVTVTPSSPQMRLRADTLEYSVAGVKLKPNATLEDLLKRLPGVQIGPDGQITINGQPVHHLLIDGEDIFSGDPRLLTRDLSADMVERIQLLNKKSKQAEFTGVDDGQRTRTVNVVLRPESKQGLFGKIDAGGAPGAYYSADGLAGSFKGASHWTAVALAASDGSTHFSGGDGQTGFFVGDVVPDGLGGSAGPGIPQVAGAGLHYSYQPQARQDHLSINYSASHVLTRPIVTTLTRQALSDSIYTQSSSANSENTNDKQSLYAEFKWLPDSINAFLFSAGAMKIAGHDEYQSTGFGLFNETLVNSSQRNIRAAFTKQGTQADAIWRRKDPQKKGRAFSIRVGAVRTSMVTNGYSYTVNDFYGAGRSLRNEDTTDERKVIASTLASAYAGVDYTAPLGRRTTWSLGYEVSVTRVRSEQSTFGKSEGKYLNLIDSLSNQYQNDALVHQATVRLVGTYNPLQYTIGGNLYRYTYKQAGLAMDSLIHLKYLIFSPLAELRYKFGRASQTTLSYSGKSQQPDISQWQPVRNNNDPLHIVVGNSRLQPTYIHFLSMGYTTLGVVRVSVGLNVGLNIHTISSRTYTDSIGRQVSQPLNVGNSNTSGLYFGFGRSLPKLNVDLEFNTTLIANRNLNYVDSLLNRNSTYNIGEGFSIGKYVANRYGFLLRSNVNVVYSRSSINLGVATRYWSQSQSAEVSYFPLPRIEITSSWLYSWQERTPEFTGSNSSLLWNADVSMSFPQKKLSAHWHINDILGQNVSINRNASGNTITQNTANVPGRYWMLSLTWRFGHQHVAN